MKLLIRAGLALALGFGALAAAPRAALARTPCPSACVAKDPPCAGSTTTVNDAANGKGTKVCTAQMALLAPAYTVTNCLDCGTCANQNVDVTVTERMCYKSCKTTYDSGVIVTEGIAQDRADKEDYTPLGSACTPPAP